MSVNFIFKTWKWFYNVSIMVRCRSVIIKSNMYLLLITIVFYSFIFLFSSSFISLVVFIFIFFTHIIYSFFNCSLNQKLFNHFDKKKCIAGCSVMFKSSKFSNVLVSFICGLISCDWLDSDWSMFSLGIILLC